MRPPSSFETRPFGPLLRMRADGERGQQACAAKPTARAASTSPRRMRGNNRIIARVQKTWPAAGLGRLILPIGYFANVIELDGVGLALCTDGVGSKTIIADMMGKYDTIGIDCVAMNVNDMICVGAKPLSLVDYIEIDTTHAAILDAVGDGRC